MQVHDGRPVLAQDVEADVAGVVDVGMVDSVEAFDRRRLNGVRVAEHDREPEVAATVHALLRGDAEVDLVLGAKALRVQRHCCGQFEGGQVLLDAQLCGRGGGAALCWRLGLCGLPLLLLLQLAQLELVSVSSGGRRRVHGATIP